MKSILVILFFVFVSSTTNAQLTMGLRVGAHLPTSGIAIPDFVQIESDGTQKGLVGTFGGGFDLNAIIGIELNKNVAMGFDMGYLNGFNVAFYQHADLDGTGDTRRVDVTSKGRFINVSPHLIVKANSKNNAMAIVPYARLGLHTGLATVTTTTEIAGMQGRSVDKYSGNWSLGLVSAMGLARQINKKAGWFMELTIKTISVRPKEVRNIENFEGEDVGKVTRFVKEKEPNGPTNNELVFMIPFSSLGIGLGFQYKLGK